MKTILDETKYFLNHEAKFALNSQIIFVLIISGLAGFCMGLFGYPTWQVAVEPAQVVAGLIHYPQENPNYIYQFKTWTILHQISAFFLHLGVSEKLLSWLLSGIVGMIAYQAIALWVFAIGDDYLLALMSPFIVHFMISNNMLMGITYPIWLMGYSHTYGILGLSFIFFVAGLIGSGNYKLGCFFLGLSPAIHPSLGLWLNLTVFICFLLDYKYMSKILKRNLHYILSGYFISALSLGLHLFMTHAIADKMSGNVSYFNALIHFWDVHRQPFSLYTFNVFLVVVVFMTSVLCLSNNKIKNSSRFLFLSIIGSSLLGAIFSITYWLPPEKVPHILLSLMPARLLNYNLLSAAPLLIGLLGFYKDNFLIQCNLIVFCLLLLLNLSCVFIILFAGLSFLLLTWLVANYSNISQRLMFGLQGLFLILYGLLLYSYENVDSVTLSRYSSFKPYAVSFFLFIGTFLLLSLSIKVNKIFRSILIYPIKISTSNFSLKNMHRPYALRFLVLALCMLITFSNIKVAYYSGKTQRADFWNKSVVFAKAAEMKGMLLTCSDMMLIQLRTNRPVLLDGGSLDGIAYTPSAGYKMNQILKKVYHVNFLSPPQSIKNKRPGALLHGTGKKIWEGRTMSQWQEIAREYGVTNILCYTDWKLQLPEIARDKKFALYAINDTW